MRKSAGITVLLVSAAAALYALASLGASEVALRELDAERGALERKAAALAAETERLESCASSGSEAERIERVARELLGLVYPDELIFRDIG